MLLLTFPLGDFAAVVETAALRDGNSDWSDITMRTGVLWKNGKYKIANDSVYDKLTNEYYEKQDDNKIIKNWFLPIFLHDW